MSYDRYDRQRGRQNNGRSVIGYWVPLVFTVAVATGGIAAWIWSEVKDRDEHEEYPDDRRRFEDNPPGYDGRPGEGPSGQIPGQMPGQMPGQFPGQASGRDFEQGEDASFTARMSGALRRTPSPQQLFDGASKKVAAGVAAAGAVVGSALQSIREEDPNEHGRPSYAQRPSGDNNVGISGSRNVADSGFVRKTSGDQYRNVRRKTVAVVISAEHELAGLEQDDGYPTEEAVSYQPRNRVLESMHERC
jgi:hypothetical protein